MSQIVETEL